MCAYLTSATIKLLITCLFVEEIAYCSATGDIVGYVDFGEESLTSCSKSKEEMATHIVNDVIPRPPFLPSLQTRLVVIDLDIFKFKTRTVSR